MADSDDAGLSRTGLLLRLLPAKAKKIIGDMNVTVRRSSRRIAFCASSTRVGDKWKDEVTSHTKPYDVYLGRMKIGIMDFHFEKEEVDTLEYRVKIGGRVYGS